MENVHYVTLCSKSKNKSTTVCVTVDLETEGNWIHLSIVQQLNLETQADASKRYGHWAGTPLKSTGRFLELGFRGNSRGEVNRMRFYIAGDVGFDILCGSDHFSAK
jgi:hypothetical protein